MRVICVDDVLSLFTEREQAFVRDDLEVSWDDSDIFTVEVAVPLKETPYMMVLEVTVDPVNELVTIERRRA
jgi:hypothetical protein